MHRLYPVLASLACLVSLACTPPTDRGVENKSTTEAQSVKPAAAVTVVDIPALIAVGDYGAAIEAVNRSDVNEAEKLGTSGRLMLDALVDPAAKAQPTFTIADAIARMERAAALGRTSSVSDLIGVFEIGVNYRGKNVVLNAVPELASCWRSVRDAKRTGGECVALRGKLGVAAR